MKTDNEEIIIDKDLEKDIYKIEDFQDNNKNEK